MIKKHAVIDLKGLSYIPNDYVINKRYTSVSFENASDIRHIGARFLAFCDQLTLVDFSSLYNVTSIGVGFMYGCKSIEFADLSPLRNAVSIGAYFMSFCESLHEIDLSLFKNLNEIGGCFASSTPPSLNFVKPEHVKGLSYNEYQ